MTRRSRPTVANRSDHVRQDRARPGQRQIPPDGALEVARDGIGGPDAPIVGLRDGRAASDRHQPVVERRDRPGLAAVPDPAWPAPGRTRRRGAGADCIANFWSPLPAAACHEDRPLLFRPRAMMRCGEVALPPDVVVAIPVCNEAERIVACVDALATTLAWHPCAGVVLLVNNSVDASARTAFRALAARGVTAIVVETTLVPGMATAGWARRLAMDVAARWAHPDAVLMTTDADGRVAPDWAETNLALLARGAHLVCGHIAPDAAEAALLPLSIARSDATERAYTALSIELDALLDPRPHDPWPHHGLASGASLAIRARDYRVVGRMPPLPCSEDRAFAAQVERHDLCVRHSDAPRVTVSCRLRGRARGGMADAIAARIADPDSLADQRLLPAAITVRRATFRRALRSAWVGKGDIGGFMGQLDLPAAHVARARRAQSFGACWAMVEAGAQSLAAPRLRPSDLERELPELRRLVVQARAAR